MMITLGEWRRLTAERRRAWLPVKVMAVTLPSLLVIELLLAAALHP